MQKRRSPLFARTVGIDRYRIVRSDFVDGLVIAVIDAVTAFNALDVVDGELLLFFHNGTVGALGFTGTALNAAFGDHICHNATSVYFTSPLRST